MTSPTKEEVHAVFQVALAVAEAIKELGSVPSGHLYARLMDKMTLNTYNQIIGILKHGGLVKESNHELTWIGPR